MASLKFLDNFLPYVQVVMTPERNIKFSHRNSAIDVKHFERKSYRNIRIKMWRLLQFIFSYCISVSLRSTHYCSSVLY